MSARDPTELIRAALPEVSALMIQAFDAVGGTPVSGSELDQAGLADGVEIVERHLAYGEAGVALEHLIYMVREPGLPISAGTYALIADAGRTMNMEPATWEGIQPRL